MVQIAQLAPRSLLRNTLAPKVGADPNHPYLPNSPTATPERGTARDYRYERTR